MNSSSTNNLMSFQYPLLSEHDDHQIVSYTKHQLQEEELEEGMRCKSFIQQHANHGQTIINNKHVTLSNRRPFHYPPDKINIGQYNYGTFGSDSQSNLIDCSEITNNALIEAPDAIYSRYRYYDRLFNFRHSGAIHHCVGVIHIPDHVIPWYFRIPKILVSEFEIIPEEGKQSSIITIFAIWNMMMGTSLLSLPWATRHAGLIGGNLVIFLMTSLCFYTASMVEAGPKIIKVHVQEFTDLVSLLLGNFAHKISQISSLSIITGGCIVYWILMTNFLRHLVSFVYQVQFMNATIGMNASAVVCATALNLVNLEPDDDSLLFFKVLDYAVPALLVFLVGPIMCLKSVSIFLRFSILGTLSVFFLIGFAIFKALHWGLVHIDLHDPYSPHYVELFNWNFPIYTGVLSLALFIHNCLTTLLRTQKLPKNNQRDLAIAYVLVGITYLLISSAIYISFPLDKNCIRDNFLDNLESNDLYALITRGFLLLQVMTLFPLLVYMLRVQVLSLFQQTTPLIEAEISTNDNRHLHHHHHRGNNNESSPNDHHSVFGIVTLNIILLVCCVLFATYYPQIGSVIRYSGSFSGLILIFTLPPITYIRAREISKRPVSPALFVLLCLIILLGYFNFFSQFFVQP